eukprot:761016-Pelagomonas_calceolata.AAC.1
MRIEKVCQEDPFRRSAVEKVGYDSRGGGGGAGEGGGLGGVGLGGGLGGVGRSGGGRGGRGLAV